MWLLNYHHHHRSALNEGEKLKTNPLEVCVKLLAFYAQSQLQKKSFQFLTRSCYLPNIIQLIFSLPSPTAILHHPVVAMPFQTDKATF